VLCCQNGLSHEEAAQILDAPVGTVKTNILRGKEKLKRLFVIMNTPEDPVDALLREQNDYLDDQWIYGEGRQATAPPPPRVVTSGGVAGAVAIGAVLAWSWLPLKNLPPVSFANLFSTDFNAPVAAGDGGGGGGALVWGAIAALQRRIKNRPGSG